jgi:drug/metabolite transporter (DMT)-like permease
MIRTPSVVLPVLLLGILLGAAGNGLLAAGMRRVGPPGRLAEVLDFLGRAAREPRIFVGVALQAAFFGSFLLALSSADLSFVLPVTALDHVITAVVALLVLGERPPTLRWVGIALVVVGVTLVLGSEHSTPAPVTP